MRVVRERWLGRRASPLLCIFIALAYSSRTSEAVRRHLAPAVPQLGPASVLFSGSLNQSSTTPRVTRSPTSSSSPPTTSPRPPARSSRPLTPAAASRRSPSPSRGERRRRRGHRARPDPLLRRPDRQRVRGLIRRVSARAATGARSARRGRDPRCLDELPRTNGNAERRSCCHAPEVHLGEPLQSGSVEVVDHAVVPTGRRSRSPSATRLGFCFGSCSGSRSRSCSTCSTAASSAPRTSRTTYDMRDDHDIPQQRVRRAHQRRRERVAAFEAYRMACNGTRRCPDARRTTSSRCSSPARSGEEGKSSVAVNLARAVAIAGQRVVLDRGRPAPPGFGRHFDARHAPGGLTTSCCRSPRVGRVAAPDGSPGLRNPRGAAERPAAARTRPSCCAWAGRCASCPARAWPT